MIEDYKKTVFFVTRIGSETSPERRRSDDIMEYLLEPAVHASHPELKVVRADNVAAHGRITDQIVLHLLHSAVIVADTTGLNPNVFYELGIAHARFRPVVLLVDAASNIPFDTRNEAHIILGGHDELSARSVQDCLPRLTAALDVALTATVPPGPVAAAQATLVLARGSYSDVVCGHAFTSACAA